MFFLKADTYLSKIPYTLHICCTSVGLTSNYPRLTIFLFDLNVCQWVARYKLDIGIVS